MARNLQLTTFLGSSTEPVTEGTFNVIDVKVKEGISIPFELEIQTFGPAGVGSDQLLQQSMTLKAQYESFTPRLFNGVVRRVESRWQQGMQKDIEIYKFFVVPRLWFLRQTIDCRIFQRKTTEEILTTIFQEHNIGPFSFFIAEDALERPYTTQYDETDWDFVHRIMQDSGYFYYFKHDDGKHTMVIADANEYFVPPTEPVYRIVGNTTIENGNNYDVINRWSEARETAYGRVTLQDRDPEKPNAPVSGEDETSDVSSPGWGQREVYRWPAMTTRNKVAADRAKFYIQSSEAAASLNSGHGSDLNLRPGFRFKLADLRAGGTLDDMNEYVIREVTHRMTEDVGHTGGTVTLPESTFTCFPKNVQWRDALSIPRPTMAGVFSGIVLGNEGEETHTDNLARIKVQPLFDHRKDTTADQSIFIRILHAWSGDRWGWQHLPRVGTEVGIAFMNGDPDNPVVAGCFFHNDNMPVFPVSVHQTRQGFRDKKPANLTGDGFAQLAFGDFNELSFEHKQAEEEIFLNAQKDLNVSVVNNTKIIHRDGFVLIKSPIKITLDVGDGASRIVMTPENISITSPTLTMRSGLTTMTYGLTTLTTGDFTFTTGEYTATTGDVTWSAGDFKLLSAAINFVGEQFSCPVPEPNNL